MGGDLRNAYLGGREPYEGRVTVSLANEYEPLPR